MGIGSKADFRILDISGGMFAYIYWELMIRIEYPSIWREKKSNELHISELCMEQIYSYIDCVLDFYTGINELSEVCK